MKIYFTASSDVSENTKKAYLQIIDILKDTGASISQTVMKNISDASPTDNVFEKVNQEIMNCIDEADLVVADISYPSGGVGYQIYHTYLQKKPMAIIYTENESSNPSIIIRGIKADNVTVYKYSSIDDLRIKLPELIEKISKYLNVRFNLVISNHDYSFIESEAKKANISKTRYLKNLISLARKKS